jgi:hypothetical protein
MFAGTHPQGLGTPNPIAIAWHLLKAFAEVREPRAGKGDPILAMLDDGVSVLALADFL